MTEDLRSVDGAGRRRRPATRDARVEQLVGGRAMVPHGDRVQRAQSGRFEDQKMCYLGDDDVVRVFVLHDHVDDRQIGSPNDVFERAQHHAILGALHAQTIADGYFFAQVAGAPGYPRDDGRRDR